MRCSKCGFDNPGGMKFCGQCTAPLALVCPNCHFENPPGFKFCGQCTTALGSGLAKPRSSNSPITTRETDGAAAFDGERKTVTALFADIKGSTDLMAELDPEEARSIIDPALKLMIEAVRRYNGYIVQSTGDGIFALFGAPLAHEDHPQRALYAALRMQEELRRYSTRTVADGGSPIQCRVGANTGEVVVRSIATGEGHVEYTPIGHTTNLASRMQAVAPVGSIAVTEMTRRWCEGYFAFKTLGPTRLRGIPDPIEVHEVTGLGPLRTRLQRAVGRGLTKFIGRETELKQMRHALELARNGHGQIVAAIGEPGVGKSRLFYEFKAVSQAGSLLLEAYSVSHGKASAYLPVTEMLRDYFRIVPEDDIRQRREKVAGKIVILDRNLEDTLPYICALLGIVESEGPLAQIDTEIRRRRTCEAIKRVLLRESLNQPLIVIFEDLHWIDSDTQALLDMLADGIASARVLLLVNYRSEYRHEWSDRTYYTQLRLDPLARKSADEMLRELLGDAHELAPLKRAIANRTEGNPFFIEEIVEALFEEGVLTRNGSTKLALPFSGATLPTTVQGILASRIDRLAPKEKELLQTLAAIGREFPLSLAKRVANCSDAELDRMLARLQSSEFIYEQPATGDVEYTFKHALTQEVAYKSLLIEHRKLLHERIGQAIESLFVDHIDDHLKDLAHHYDRSSNTAKAIEYLRRAGEHAVVRTFYEEAIEQLNSALKLLEKHHPGHDRDKQELAIRRSLMAPFLAVYALSSNEIQENARRLLNLCKENGEGRLRAQVLVHLFFSYWNKMDLERADTFAREALEVGENSADEYQIFFGNFVAGLYSGENGKYVSARQLLERARRISGQTEAAILADPSIALAMINCVGHLALVLWILGYPNEARQHKARLVTILSGSLDPVARALAIGHLLTIHRDLLRDDRMISVQADEALIRSMRSGLNLPTAVGLISLGRIMVAEGSVDTGTEKLADGMLMFENVGDNRNYYMWSYVAIATYLKAHRITDGMALIERAISQMDRGGVRLFEADLYRLKGEFILMAGRPENEAEAAFRDAIAIARRGQAKSFELRATISLARLLVKNGRRDEARVMLADIYGWFTEGFDTADLNDARALLDELSS
jgi:class 3 adenylate cyclase/tetratricopeptide (TPR) repeat protein